MKTFGFSIEFEQNHLPRLFLKHPTRLRHPTTRNTTSTNSRSLLPFSRDGSRIVRRRMGIKANFKNDKPNRNRVPFTLRSVVKYAVPAQLVALQVYFPMCSACTESMFKMLAFFPWRLMTISLKFFTGLPLRNHSMSMGLSPLLTVQYKEADSPAFMVSCPKSNGVM